MNPRVLEKSNPHAVEGTSFEIQLFDREKALIRNCLRLLELAMLDLLYTGCGLLALSLLLFLFVRVAVGCHRRRKGRSVLPDGARGNPTPSETFSTTTTLRSGSSIGTDLPTATRLPDLESIEQSSGNHI